MKSQVELGTFNPYEPVSEIWTVDDFDKIRNNMTGNYRLMRDITLPADFATIGSKDDAFRGSLCGTGYLHYSLDTDRPIIDHTEPGWSYAEKCVSEGFVCDGIFKNCEVHVDGNSFYRCRFTACTFIYDGIKPAHFDTCHFEGETALNLGDNDNATEFGKQIRELSGNSE